MYQNHKVTLEIAAMTMMHCILNSNMLLGYEGRLHAVSMATC